MDERARNIARAGYDVISQYGIRRATMGDIAAAAGVSRQTVYNVFPNREELLSGVARYHFVSRWEAIHEATEGVEQREERFTILLDILVVSSWETLHTMPHAEELELEIGTTMRERLDDVHVQATRNLGEFLSPYEDRLQSRGLSSKGLAEMLHLSIIGLKLSSTSCEQIKTVVASLKACLLAVTD